MYLYSYASMYSTSSRSSERISAVGVSHPPRPPTGASSPAPGMDGDPPSPTFPGEGRHNGRPDAAGAAEMGRLKVSHHSSQKYKQDEAAALAEARSSAKVRELLAGDLHLYHHVLVPLLAEQLRSRGVHFNPNATAGDSIVVDDGPTVPLDKCA